MQLSGQKILKADNKAIWNLLMNPGSLARIIPGISKLEKTAENIYKSVLEIQIGPVSGYFEGTVELDEIVENSSFNLKVRQNSKIGDANASVRIILSEVNLSETELAFNGEVKLTGLLARMGQRMVSGVANTLIKQFFTNMEEELQKQFAA
jgi:uncharacterized protein